MPELQPAGGNQRHPTAAPPAAAPHGRTIPGNARTAQVTYYVPDPLAVQTADGLAIGTNTVSPMARGGNFFQGLAGFGVHRFAGRIAGAVQTFTTPIAPINNPKSVRVGMQSGPSSSPAYPSTGTDATFGSLALMSHAAYGAYGMGG